MTVTYEEQDNATSGMTNMPQLSASEQAAIQRNPAAFLGLRMLQSKATTTPIDEASKVAAIAELAELAQVVLLALPNNSIYRDSALSSKRKQALQTSCLQILEALQILLDPKSGFFAKSSAVSKFTTALEVLDPATYRLKPTDQLSLQYAMVTTSFITYLLADENFFKTRIPIAKEAVLSFTLSMRDESLNDLQRFLHAPAPQSSITQLSILQQLQQSLVITRDWFKRGQRPGFGFAANGKNGYTLDATLVMADNPEALLANAAKNVTDEQVVSTPDNTAIQLTDELVVSTKNHPTPAVANKPPRELYEEMMNSLLACPEFRQAVGLPVSSPSNDRWFTNLSGFISEATKATTTSLIHASTTITAATTAAITSPLTALAATPKQHQQLEPQPVMPRSQAIVDATANQLPSPPSSPALTSPPSTRRQLTPQESPLTSPLSLAKNNSHELPAAAAAAAAAEPPSKTTTPSPLATARDALAAQIKKVDASIAYGAANPPSRASRVIGGIFGSIKGLLVGFYIGFTKPGLKGCLVGNLLLGIGGALYGLARGCYLGCKHGYNGSHDPKDVSSLKVAPLDNLSTVLQAPTLRLPGRDSTQVKLEQAKLHEQFNMFRQDTLTLYKNQLTELNLQISAERKPVAANPQVNTRYRQVRHHGLPRRFRSSQ